MGLRPTFQFRKRSLTLNLKTLNVRNIYLIIRAMELNDDSSLNLTLNLTLN